MNSLTFSPVIIQRGSDMLTVVEITDNSKVTARDIANIAAEQPHFPKYIPSNANAILLFHTEGGAFVLGGVRSNPALKDQHTKDGTSFPQQINASLGGYSPNPNLPFREALINSIKNKMFLNSDLPENGLEVQKILKEVCTKIENNDGWEEKVCVHTDKWLEKDTEKTMSVITAVKHIHCSDSELAKIDAALKVIMSIKKEEIASLGTLSEFKFVELQPIIANSLESHLEDEITKATVAYERFGDKVAVTFNYLAIATLVKNNAFKNNNLVYSKKGGNNGSINI